MHAIREAFVLGFLISDECGLVLRDIGGYLLYVCNAG